MAKYLTFADELIVEHGVKFNPDTVIVNADEVARHLISQGFVNNPKGNSKPLFGRAFVESCTAPGRTCGIYIYFVEGEDGPLAEFACVYKFDQVVFTGLSNYIRGYSIDGELEQATMASAKSLFQTTPDSRTVFPKGMLSALGFRQEMLGEFKNSEDGVLQLAYYTLAFMRQRGQIEEVTHPHKLARNIERRTGKAPSNYYRVIPIGPGVKQYKYKSAPQGTHASPRLHSVRPHIRVVENHPLPQFNGEFFIPAHFRGQGGSEGKARKIYRVVL